MSTRPGSGIRRQDPDPGWPRRRSGGSRNWSRTGLAIALLTIVALPAWATAKRGNTSHPQHAEWRAWLRRRAHERYLAHLRYERRLREEHARHRAWLRRVRLEHEGYLYGGQVWTTSPFARHLDRSDITAGEDPRVRAAAVRALGNRNGTAVVVNPDDGRILAMVNQKLALSSSYQPCSTTKLAIAVAALNTGTINENTLVRIPSGRRVNLTTALAYSINAYFEAVGRRMGFRTVSHYERLLGLGRRVGFDIAGESPGIYPLAPGRGGVAKLCSFGQGIYITPLQLASLVSTIANGGTIYYLQHPKTERQAEHFQPRVRLRLRLGRIAPQIEDGMMAAVRYGTARGAWMPGVNILGKTGTCSRGTTRYGLFASVMGVRSPRLAVVVVLRGNHKVYGPLAAKVAGNIYRSLYHTGYFVHRGWLARNQRRRVWTRYHGQRRR